MVQIPAWSNAFPLACRSRAILPTLVGLCFYNSLEAIAAIIGDNVANLCAWPHLFCF